MRAETAVSVEQRAGTSSDPGTVEEAERRTTRLRRMPEGIDLLAALCVIAAILPVVVATVRAISGDWRAIGDNAYFSIRAADVFTEHHPLLGSWTSASIAIGLDVNNAGPLLFDVLAMPVRIGGPDAGLAVGVALVNIASILGIALIARRQAGATAVVVAMAAATGLGWALGSELLFEPWQPHSLIFPFLCFLFMAWALVAGDLVMLPWAVGLGSYVAQTHVGYALLVPTLGGLAVAAAGARHVAVAAHRPRALAGSAATHLALCRGGGDRRTRLLGPARHRADLRRRARQSGPVGVECGGHRGEGGLQRRTEVRRHPAGVAALVGQALRVRAVRPG